MKKKLSWFLALCSLLCLSCVSSSNERISDNIMRHAKLIQLSPEGDAVIINPWDTTSVLQHYTIKSPARHAAVFISTHCALLDELGLHDHYTDFSKDASPNIEKIVQLKPDIILVSPFENGGGNGALEKLGIPVIQCADYMETTPLGRAEWMRFYARLFGADADCLFSSVEKEYTQNSTLKTQHSKLKVLTDLIYGSTWYVPGGNSTIAHIINDAGGDYIFSDNAESGSLSLSPEAVVEQSIDADIWLLRYGMDTDLTYSSFAKEHPLYSRIKAFKNKKIFGCNLNHVPFFEECPFHPERLLRDLRNIFDNTSSSDSLMSNRYFTPLK